METREDHIGKLSAAQLKELSAPNDEMNVPAGPAKAEARKSAGELAWQDLKARIRQSAS